MPFLHNKPDASINAINARYPPIVVEAAITQSYEEVLQDAREWLTKTDGAVSAVLVIKLTETKTDLIPPPDSVDEATEGDNSPDKLNPNDPEFAPFRRIWESTKPEDWFGPHEAFAEFWRPDGATGDIKMQGERMTLLPRPADGVKPITISLADVKGPVANPGDEKQTWGLSMETYADMLTESVKTTAFLRSIRYLRVTGKDKP